MEPLIAPIVMISSSIGWVIVMIGQGVALIVREWEEPKQMYFLAHGTGYVVHEESCANALLVYTFGIPKSVG